jgi:hypothetical protein
MKNYFLILFFSLAFISYSQNNKGKANDEARIILSTYVSDAIKGFPSDAKTLLQSKLDKIATFSGMGGSKNSSRFIITANVDIVSKEITPTAPAQHMYTLEVSYYIGDAVTGTKFSSCSKSYVGVAPSEIKAYKDALSQIKPNEPIFKQFINDGKTKIIEYYNSKCDFILKEAEMLSSKNDFDAAISTLTSIPEVCKDCYDKAMSAVAPIYKKYIDRQCKASLMEAKNAWNQSQDASGASSASNYLGQIDPNASCYAEAIALTNTIAKRIKELDQREWNFQMKQQQDDVDIQKATIKAVRDIGVAYGNGPKATVLQYNVYGWW